MKKPDDKDAIETIAKIQEILALVNMKELKLSIALERIGAHTEPYTRKVYDAIDRKIEKEMDAEISKRLDKEINKRLSKIEARIRKKVNR